MPQMNAPDSDFKSASTFGKAPASPEPYLITSSNWYKSQPYGFAFWDIEAKPSEKARSTIYLPIAPSNLVVNTNFATNVITTLYGIIEEHSEVRYYDITIQGTTGYAPRFISAFQDGTKKSDSQSTGRSAFIAQGLDFGGFLPEVTNTINQVLNTANEIGNTLNGGPSNPTGIDPDKSGYVAFHNLYRFFLKYKNDAAQVAAATNTASVAIPVALPTDTKPKRKVHPIQFLNYKDGISYDCVPLSFTMIRSVDNPMIYNYSIKLRGFNLRNVNTTNHEANQLEKFGLGGLDGQSLFSKMTSVAGNASTLISGIL
jgi:hypothetical protein